MQNTIMDSKDAVYGSLAECLITIEGRRYNFMNLIDFESKWEVNLAQFTYWELRNISIPKNLSQDVENIAGYTVEEVSRFTVEEVKEIGLRKV